MHLTGARWKYIGNDFLVSNNAIYVVDHWSTFYAFIFNNSNYIGNQ